MNNISDIELFELLKKDITNHFFESNSASSHNISDWKGQDIVTFQEELFQKTKSTVSEKWFYTYFKSDFKKLPRIDMLNILAQYAGYSGWSAFIVYHKNQREEENKIANESLDNPIEVIENTTEKELNKSINEGKTELGEVKDKKARPKKRGLIVSFVSIILLIIGALGIYYGFFYQKTYEFCFVDADRNTFISEPIEVTVARPGFTPLELLTNKGCVEFSSYEDTLLMTIKSTYYKQDTFKINLHQYQGKENIRLEPDDYKVMLRHYSKSSQSVKERIKKLDEMIANDALIYQVYDNEYFGVEVLSKKQYINLVSLPTTSLKNFTLIEAERKNGKIVKIKFKIHSDEN